MSNFFRRVSKRMKINRIACFPCPPSPSLLEKRSRFPINWNFLVEKYFDNISKKRDKIHFQRSMRFFYREGGREGGSKLIRRVNSLSIWKKIDTNFPDGWWLVNAKHITLRICRDITRYRTRWNVYGKNTIDQTRGMNNFSTSPSG